VRVVPRWNRNVLGRVLPELADGAMVFLFAPDQEWMADDPWVAASATSDVRRSKTYSTFARQTLVPDDNEYSPYARISVNPPRE